MRRGRGPGKGWAGIRAWSGGGVVLRRGVVWGRGGGRGGGYRAGFWEPGEPGAAAVAGGGSHPRHPHPRGSSPGQRWGGWSVSPRCDPIDGFVLAAGPGDPPPHGPHGRPAEGGDTGRDTGGPIPAPAREALGELPPTHTIQLPQITAELPKPHPWPPPSLLPSPPRAQRSWDEHPRCPATFPPLEKANLRPPRFNFISNGELNQPPGWRGGSSPPCAITPSTAEP